MITKRIETCVMLRIKFGNRHFFMCASNDDEVADVGSCWTRAYLGKNKSVVNGSPFVRIQGELLEWNKRLASLGVTSGVQLSADG